MRRFLAVVWLVPGLLWAAPASAAVRPELAAQIRTIQADKAARTQAQRKIGSQLLYAARLRRGLPAVAGVPSLRAEVEVDAAGRALVDLAATPTPRLLARLGALGGEVVGQVPAARALRARVPLDALEALAGEPEVVRIRPAGRATTRANTTQGD